MKIGLLKLELSMPWNHSLKGKRSVLRSLKDRIRNGFNVSIAEVDSQENWQKAVLAVVCVGDDQKYLNGQLNRIRTLVEAGCNAELVKCKMDFLS